MSHEQEKRVTYTIESLKPADIEAATEMRLQSWLDTYVSEEHGVTREWIQQRNERQLTPEARAARMERFLKTGSVGWVAKDESGVIVGVTTPYVDKRGVQHLGSLYTDKRVHGKGVGSALIQKVIEWADLEKPIVLGVVSYNERAKAFYRKWGFEEIPDSEELFDDKIPEVKMVRPAEATNEI